MKFGILVNEGPYQHQSADSAYQFTKAALENGHEIFRVFFYHDGVNNSTRYAIPPQDDRKYYSSNGLSCRRNISLISLFVLLLRKDAVS